MTRLREVLLERGLSFAHMDRVCGLPEHTTKNRATHGLRPPAGMWGTPDYMKYATLYADRLGCQPDDLVDYDTFDDLPHLPTEDGDGMEIRTRYEALLHTLTCPRLFKYVTRPWAAEAR